MAGSPSTARDVVVPAAPPADGARDAPVVIDQRAVEERAEMLRRGLRRMRTIATLLLLAMTAIFVATTVTKLDWPWLPYLRAFAEAGMVGACADWFAVVALFRRPLGLPIPHTGIIPNNKERIGGALSRFMTNNFLTAPVLNERLARVDVIGAIAHWLDNPQNAERLGAYLAEQLPRVVDSLPGPRIGETLGRLAQQVLATIPAAPAASKLLAIVWAQGEAQALIAQAIDYAQGYLAGNKDYFSHKIAQQSSSWIPKWIDKIIADKVMNGVLSTLTEMREPKHPWRVELHKTVQGLIVKLAADPQMHARGEAFKAELLANPLFVEQAKVLWAELESGLQWGIPAHAEAIAHTVEQALHSIGRWLQEDPDRQEQINCRIRAVALHMLLAYRVEIGGYIERVVRNWDSSTLVNRLELQVGKDLQFIRINGTLVGGLVGLLIFIASKWIATF
ncbi:MAG TPA: DUF445 domain-containing protein [Xanthobacteraceae bacterium]|jgi:uncharacterized membrane-anchored protein YjiN (DUF445 family)|nr:DUF445 domain-containing protein [Xanthobacteraceae bacterium]